jgi:N-acetylglucosamine-6-phosphate deacetylase
MTITILLPRCGVSSVVVAGNILTPDGFIDGELTVVDGRISTIRGAPISENEVRASSSPIVLPGFIDCHVHGGAGRDIMEGNDAIHAVSRIHAQHGTTSMLATTMTAPAADLDVAFQALQAHCSSRNSQCARVLGVHLEGPYINQSMLGAQPDFARPLQLAELASLHAKMPIRLITMAPEVPGNLALIPALVASGHVVQIGHTAGSYEDGAAAIANGATGFTHLFNAMTGMHHRKPGMVGAALAHAEYAEIIPDLLHVHAGAIRVAMRAIPKLFCVTDSTAAAGMPDGEYRLGRHTVTKCMGGVRLPDGTLAGSSLTMDQALRNLVNELGLDLINASKRVSTNAADYLGLPDRGRLQKDAWADMVVLNQTLQLTGIFVEGVSVE